MYTYFASTLVYVLAIFNFVIITRFLSKQDYGLLSIFFITIILCGRGLTLGFQNYIVAKTSSFSSLRKNKTICTLFSFQLFVVIVFFIFALLFAKPIINYFNLANYTSIFYFVIVIISLLPLIYILNSYFFSKQKTKTSVTITLFENGWLLFVILFALIFGYLTLDVIFTIRLILTIFVITGIIVLLLKIDTFKLVIPNKKILKTALVFSIPLLPLIISAYFITAADRYILGFFEGGLSVGIYAYFYSLLQIILSFSLLPTTLLFSYSAKEYVRNIKKSKFFFNAAAKYSLMLLIPGLVGIYVLRNEIVTLISGPKYLSDTYILPFLILFPLLEYFSHFYRQICMLRSRTKYLAVTYVFAGIINIVLNFILIPLYSIKGAAIATIITYALLFALLFWENNAFMEWDFSFFQIHKIVICSLIMGFVISFFHPTEVVSKLLTIAFGAGIYFALLFLSKTFVQDEIKLMKSILESRPLSKRLSKKIFR